MDTKLIVSASPHVRSEETTQSLMANVIVALCPCVVASAIIFGVRALLVTAVSVIASGTLIIGSGNGGNDTDIHF